MLRSQRVRLGKLFKMLNSRYVDLQKNSKFVKWSERMEKNPTMRDDPFTQLLYQRYARDHDLELSEIEAKLIRVTGLIMKTYSVRVFSVSKTDLMTFEEPLVHRWLNIREGQKIDTHRWPPVWEISRVMGVHQGAGNASQSQVSLSWRRNLYGVYDIRGRIPVRIGEPLGLHDRRVSTMSDPFDFTDPRGYVEKCRVTS